MTEVAAALGISADSSGLASAVRELRNIDDAARGAVEGLGGFGRAADKAGAAAASIGTASDKAARDASKLESAYDRVRSAIDPIYASSKKYESALRTLTAAERAHIITGDELVRLNDMATGKYLALKNAVDQAAAAESKAASARAQAQTQYERLRASVDKVFASSKQYEAGLNSLNTLLAAGDITQKQYDTTLGMLATKLLQVKTNTDSLAASTASAKRQQDQALRAYEQTRAAIDPMFAASKRYEAALENLNEALRRNIISQQQYNALSDQAANAHLGLAGAANATAGAMNGSRYAITNASFQLQDFAVQVASGQSAMVAFTQQFPQLLGALGFTSKLAVWGAIAGTVVAAAGAIYMAWSRAKDVSEESDTALEKYNQTLQRYVQLAGSGADASNAMARNMGNISLGRTFEAFSQSLDDFRVKAEGTFTFWEKMMSNEGALGNKGGGAAGVQDMLDSIAEAFAKPQAEASRLYASIQQLASVPPTSLNEIVTQAESLDAAFRAAYGTMSRAPEGVQEIWTQVVDMGIAAANEIDASMQKIGANLGQVNAQITAAIEKQRQQKAYADDYLTASQQTVDMLSAIRAYGEDSAQVEAMRRDHALANADAMFQQQGIAGQLLVDLNNAAAATYDAEAATSEWAARMADVNAQLQGAFSLLNSIGGGMVAAAGIRAANKVLDAGGTAIAAEQARRRREEELRLYNEQDAMVARGQSTPGVANMALENQRQQWEAEDAYQARIEAQREAEREAAKAARGGGRGRKPAKSEAMKEAEREQKRMENDADRIYEKTRTNLERLAIEQQELNELYAEGYFGPVGSVTAMDTLSRAMKDVAEQYDPVLQKQKEWTDSMISGFAAMWTGGQTFLDTLANIAMKLAEMAAMEAFTTIFESSGIQKTIGSVIGSVFGVQMNAKGGVYNNSPSLSAYSNSVVSSPTMFAFAKGAGLMGEAGPEAIMPLTRGPDGRLGVSAENVRGADAKNMVSRAQIDLNVKAVPGDMFVPVVEEIAGKQADLRVTRASEAADRALPDRIAEHMADPRYR